ncbi:hypothetical protein XENOCAPTIV_005800 [Xenoophorus captivus]|uniref:Fibronectin type-III domain-containing protein n=1 Tax=Xenoophorus captivus TaxID=1517983 RepID=A0ABV0RH27_9TELE
MHCRLKGTGGEEEDPPDVVWLRDGVPLQYADTNQVQVPTGSNSWMLLDMGSYRCAVQSEGNRTLSEEGRIQLEEFPAVGYLSTLLFWCFWFPVVLPSPPRNVRAVEITQTALRLSWQPGFGGVYPIIRCSVQAKQLGDSFPADSNKMIHNQNVNIPPATHLIQDLKPHTLYSVRVACDSSQGPSDWSPWVELHTLEGGGYFRRGDVCFHPLDGVYQCVC